MVRTLKEYSFSYAWVALDACRSSSASDSTPAPSGLRATGPRRSVPPPAPRPTRTTHATSHSSREISPLDNSCNESL